MRQELVSLLCDPVDRSILSLEAPVFDREGDITEGSLVSASGRRYPIRDGVPRFVENRSETGTVESFGDQWNYFNFDEFRSNWLNHTIKNTFNSIDVFRGKTVVDAGAGSGIQSRWIAEAGAKRVIALELSHSVDDVMKRNLKGLGNVDVIQCSIDKPPIRDNAIDGIVMCHNVIQHTRSVEETAQALWRVVAPGGEFVFNCYPKNDKGLVRKVRLGVYYRLRHILSKRSFRFRLNYARTMAVLRFIPVFGALLEKASLMVRGDVVAGPRYIHRCYKAGVLNTFDCYGAHEYQHLKSDDEVRSLVRSLQGNSSKVLNMDLYFRRPPPIGIALRLQK